MLAQVSSELQAWEAPQSYDPEVLRRLHRVLLRRGELEVLAEEGSKVDLGQEPAWIC
jgi:hypothetical protein